MNIPSDNEKRKMRYGRRKTTKALTKYREGVVQTYKKIKAFGDKGAKRAGVGAHSPWNKGLSRHMKNTRKSIRGARAGGAAGLAIAGYAAYKTYLGGGKKAPTTTTKTPPPKKMGAAPSLMPDRAMEIRKRSKMPATRGAGGQPSLLANMDWKYKPSVKPTGFATPAAPMPKRKKKGRRKPASMKPKTSGHNLSTLQLAGIGLGSAVAGGLASKLFSRRRRGPAINFGGGRY